MSSIKTSIVLVGFLAVGSTLISCRSSRSNKSSAARNKPATPATEANSTSPSAQTVLSNADSALARVNQLSAEDREAAPSGDQSGQPNFSQQRTPWGAPYVPQPNLTEYGLYEAALGSYNGRRYDEAIALFSQIVTKGRPPELVPNAYYWMGESFYAQDRYAESMPYFEYVTRVGPQYKREMAYFKLSRAALHLGNKQDANLYYERLRNEYPRSHYITTLKKLGAR
jgi:TolA-binding protein